MSWPLIFHSLSQLYFYAFDIFRESGVPEEQMHYLAIGFGATELITVSLCVSISSVQKLREASEEKKSGDPFSKSNLKCFPSCVYDLRTGEIKVLSG